MKAYEEFFTAKQIERTLTALRRNNFEAIYVPDSSAAVEQVMEWIPDGATVGTGGSVTLGQIGLYKALEGRSITFIWPHQQAKNEEERIQLYRRCFSADIFITSTNAVTEDGKLYNVDATGNRVAAMLVGPRKVIVVAGKNKIVKDEEAAKRRLRELAAPQNAKRLNRKTPCTETGVCADCSSPERICNIYVTLAKKPSRTEMAVILVGENLGI